MVNIEDLRAVRLKKLALLKERGMNPFPSKVPCDFSLLEVRRQFEALEKEKKSVSVAGRLVALRGQGAILFAVLDDGTARFQGVFKKDDMAEEQFSLFSEVVDVGDILSITGLPFVTKTGEQSILVSSWMMATKALKPLPEKWHGITDEETRLRERYLDMVMTPELRDLFVKKALFWDVTRNLLKERGFLEVETPTLEVTTGGAEARPFETHHNDFDIDLYLRISVGELWQKRLLAGGFPKTFEIGRVYRNEGSSPEHVQEFTNMEFYWGYADYRDGMKLVQELYRKIANGVFGKTSFTTRGHTFDLADEWKEIDYSEEIKRQTGIDLEKASDKEIQEKLQELNVVFEGNNRERLIDTLWKYCRKKISGPAFLVNHPLIVAPLAKTADGKTALMFQPIIAGSEVGRGYSELNDPVDQKNRFDIQGELLGKGDKEAMMPDYEFVDMLEHGMPPACGFGFGERLFAFLIDKPLRETQTFPLIRPKK